LAAASAALSPEVPLVAVPVVGVEAVAGAAAGAGAGAGATAAGAGAGAAAGAGVSVLLQAARATAAMRLARTCDFFIGFLFLRATVCRLRVQGSKHRTVLQAGWHRCVLSGGL
jgi:hypothetical protein